MKSISFTYHIDDINRVASKVLDHLNSKTLLFEGAMGAGKTTFINALLKAMHSEDVATSPTFSIVNEYKVPSDKVFHFDFYRIENIDEIYNLGVEEYFMSAHWLFIEWPDRAKELIPNDAQTLTIIDIQDNKRSLKLTINTNHLTENKAMTEPKF